MKNFVVIAYHTPDELYRAEAEKMVASMRKFDLDFVVKEIQDRGGWSANTNYKPAFVRECLMMLARPVLYVDVDAIFRKYPDLINELDCDIACHMRDGFELLTGTLYFQPTDNAFKLIDDWERRIKDDPLVWEQRNLQNALHLFKGDLISVDLPASYCQIFDIMAHKGEPVIEHFQASRRCNNVAV